MPADDAQPLLLTARQAEVLTSIVNRVLKMRGDGVKNSPDGIVITQPRNPRLPGAADESSAFYIVDSAVRDGTNFRWTYSVRRVVKNGTGFDDWEILGTAVDARNTIEAFNGASGVMGNGIDSADLGGTGLELRPAPEGTIVRCWYEDRELWFEYVNSIGGSCDA